MRLVPESIGREMHKRDACFPDQAWSLVDTTVPHRRQVTPRPPPVRREPPRPPRNHAGATPWRPKPVAAAARTTQTARASRPTESPNRKPDPGEKSDSRNPRNKQKNKKGHSEEWPFTPRDIHTPSFQPCTLYGLHRVPWNPAAKIGNDAVHADNSPVAQFSDLCIHLLRLVTWEIISIVYKT